MPRSVYKAYKVLERAGKNIKAQYAKTVSTKISKVPRRLYGSLNLRQKKQSLRTSLQATVAFSRLPNKWIRKAKTRSAKNTFGMTLVSYLSDNEKMKAWIKHLLTYLTSSSSGPVTCTLRYPLSSAPLPVTAALIHKVFSKMKRGKAASPSSIIAKMLKAAVERVGEF